MFADDTNLFISDGNIGELFHQMNKELDNAPTWFKPKKLAINNDKIKWTIFYVASKKCFMPTKFPGLFNDGIVLKREPVIKFLGLRQILTFQSPLKLMKSAFYLTLKALFILKIFKFLFWLFGHVEKRLH